jgi:hypothetical protein
MEKPKPAEKIIALIRKISTATTQQAPFPLGKGGGERPHAHLLSNLISHQKIFIV